MAQIRCTSLISGTPQYPERLLSNPLMNSLSMLWSIGNQNIFPDRSIAIFCSAKCPGNLILQTYDLVCALRDAKISVIGGFHSSMEKECLDLLLRGQQPVVVCPARSIERMRLSSVWHDAISDGRLLLLSPFESKFRRPTVALAEKRNRFVATLADQIFVTHASAGGRTERLCQELSALGKPLFTLDSPDNANLIALGAKTIQPDVDGVLVLSS